MRGSKYKSVKASYAGETFDSKAEATYCRWLDREKTHGRILFYIRQPKFLLGLPEMVYRPDFLVVGSNWVVADDVKGSETPKFKKDKRLWLKYGPCPLRVVKLTCRYHEDELPTIRKIDYQIVKSQSDNRRYSPFNEAWLSATA
jgi:Protein of unknown function (DUF1064)